VWDHQTGHFKAKPLHHRQHGFRAGHSCDTALAETIDCIESAFHTGEFALGLFFDIKGAFDNLSIEETLKTMRERGMSKKFIRWYGSYLNTRTVTASMHGETQTRKPTRGFPQGGVYSGDFYNLGGEPVMRIVNSVKKKIKNINDKARNGFGFADDTNVILRGHCIMTLFNQMQQIINEILVWSNKFGLEFCMKKTQYIIFTRKKLNRKNLPDLFIKSTKVKEVDSKNEGLKYLGVILDDKLSFRLHIKDKIQQTKGKLALLRNRVRKEHECNPTWLKYCYIAVAQPTLTYAAHIWIHKLTAQHRKQMLKISRIACTIIAPQIGNAPTDGLEVILGLIPLDIHLETTAVNTFLNIENTYDTFWNGTCKNGVKKGFRHNMNMLADKYYPERLISEKTSELCMIKNFSTEQCETADIEVYTDGSKIGHNVGFGIHVRGVIEFDYYGSLRSEANVLQAEVKAIQMATQMLIEDHECNDLVIVFKTDSKSAIQGISQCKFDALSTLDARKAIDYLGRNNLVFINWVKGHASVAGNMEADRLAKLGTEYPDQEHSLVSTSYRKKSIYINAIREWNSRWLNQTDNRLQTKHWFSSINIKKSGELIKLNRNMLKNITRFITGFNFLGRHLHKVDPSITQFCRACDSFDEVEDSLHLVKECPAFLNLSKKLMPSYHSSGDWQVKEVMAFISSNEISFMLSDRRRNDDLGSGDGEGRG
jgi:ribonuclease HI